MFHVPNLPAIPSPTTTRASGSICFFPELTDNCLDKPECRHVGIWGFAFSQQARRNVRPNRVHFRYGLAVHVQLLSTSSHEECSYFPLPDPDQARATTLTPLIQYTYKRTGSDNLLSESRSDKR